MDELELQLEATKLQLEETKLQLSEKLGTLEQQVSDTVETASTAVAATVEAVQGTVENVTEAIEETVQNVSSVFDLRRQIEEHPFWVLGGAAVVGYLAAEYLTKPSRRYQVPAMVSFEEPIRPEPTPYPQSAPHVETPPSPPQATPAPQQHFQQPVPTLAEPSAWDNLRTMAISTLLGSMQGIAMRAIPEVVGMVVGNMVGSQMPTPQHQPEQSAHRARIWPDDSQPFHNAPSAEHVRSSKLS